MNSKKISKSTDLEPASSEEIEANSGSSRAGISIMGGILMLALAGVGYWAYQGQQKASALEENLARMEARLVGMVDHLEGVERTQGDYKTQLESKVHELNQNISQQSSRLNQLGGEQNWKLYEARYLAVLASERLQAFGDVATAVELIGAADQRIQELGSPDTLKVRQALANDLSTLKGTKVPDLQGIWVKLGALSHQFEKLEFYSLEDPNRRPSTDKTQKESQTGENQASLAQESAEASANISTSETKEEPVWKQSIKSSWQELKGLVKVRDYDPETFSMVISKQEQVQLLATMQLLVEQARWAAAHQDLSVYQGSLDDLSQWVNKYFVDTHEKQNLLNEIQNLKQTAISFEAPPLSSVSILDQFIRAQANPRSGRTSTITPFSNAQIDSTQSHPEPKAESSMMPDPLAREAWPQETSPAVEEALEPQSPSAPQDEPEPTQEEVNHD